METQPLFWEMPAEPKLKSQNNRQADKAMRPPIEAVKPELPSDLLPGLTEQIAINLSEPAVDLVQAQRQVREKARIEAAAKVVAQPTRGRGRGRGRGRKQNEETPKGKEQEPDTEQEKPKKQEPDTEQKKPKKQEPDTKQEKPKKQEPDTKQKKPEKQEPDTEQEKPEEQAPKAKSTPEVKPWAADWERKAVELLQAGIPVPPKFCGQTKSFTIQPSHAPEPTDPEVAGIQVLWYENQLYVLKSMISYNGTKINQKKGSTVSQRKLGGWKNAWEHAKIVAGWMPASRLHLARMTEECRC
ncbi:eag [Symbiodinium sp. CCMP2456]|nr:eag [Symbiodinium sp. CCMP2456]